MSTIATRDVLIQTGSMDAAAAFYTQVLGLQRFLDEPNLIGLEAGGLRLFLDRGPAYGPVFEFLVDDFDTAKARLCAAGCVVEQEDPSIPRCYLRDPFGLIFNLGRRSA